MRFDASGVLSFIETLNEPRPRGSDGERRAADHVAVGLENAGFSVDRVAAQPFWLPRSLGGTLLLALMAPWPSLPLLLWYLIAVDALVPDAPAWIRLGLPFLMITALGDALWFRVRKTIGHVAQAGTVHIVARDGGEHDRRARLVVLSDLVTPGPSWLPIVQWGLAAFGVSPVFKYLLSPASRQFGSLWVLSFDIVVPWLALILLAHGVPVASPRPRNGDNRTGLGVLVELAKSWPAPLRDRLELWLIATPESADLARAFSDRWTDGKPTLVLSLDAPGVGTMIRVGGRGPSAAFVADVAKSLWLPHETRPFVRSDRAAADWKVRGVPVVSLSGDHGDGPIDPALLAGVSQLVHESAMRWGKPPAAQPGPGASAARSSQNPG